MVLYGPMSKVKILTEKEVKSTVSQEIGKEHRDPQRKLKLCTYEKRKDDYWRRVVVDIQGQEFQICDHKVEESARNYFYSCYDVIPCFWSPRDLSHLTDIFHRQSTNQVGGTNRAIRYLVCSTHVCKSSSSRRNHDNAFD